MLEIVSFGNLICGVDEAGRGPLCGPVVAAAVVLNPDNPIDGLDDSKKLTEKRRESLAVLIKERALAWAIAEAGCEEIDRLNILNATMLAMTRAIEQINVCVSEVLVDGNRTPACLHPVRAIVKGDALVPAISAASILAKTHRDHLLVELDKKYPQYGFASHKGYSTPEHLNAIAMYGLTDEHRRSFAPVRAVAIQGSLFDDGLK